MALASERPPDTVRIVAVAGVVGRPDPLRLPVPIPEGIRKNFARLLAEAVSELVGKSLHAPVVANPRGAAV